MIQKATLTVFKECHSVMQKSYKDAHSKAGFPNRGRADYSYEEFANDLNNSEFLYFVCEDNIIVGILRLKMMNPDVCKLKDIAVLPEFQNKGYGKHLLFYAKAKAKEFGAKKLELGMYDDDTVLKKWYERYGFTSIGTKTYKNSPFIIRIYECIV